MKDTEENKEVPTLADVAGEPITEDEMAKEALEADEIAQRVRAFGIGVFTLLAKHDKDDGNGERTMGDPVVRLLESSIDLVDLYLHDQRRLVLAQERIAQALENQTKLIEKSLSPVYSGVDMAGSPNASDAVSYGLAAQDEVSGD